MVGLKFVDLSETSRQQVKKLFSLVSIEDTQEAGMAAQPRPGKPKSMKSLFTLSSLSTSEEIVPMRDTLRSEHIDEDYEPLKSVSPEWGSRKLPLAGICLGSLVLVVLLVLFQFPDTLLPKRSNLKSTPIDTSSSSAAAPLSSPAASPVVEAPSVETVPAETSVNSSAPPAESAPSDATFVAGIEVFRTHEQVNVRVSANGRLSCAASPLKNPERLALDFYGVRMANLQPLVPSGSEPVRRIRVSQFKPDIARVVIDLDSAVQFTMESDDNSFTVVLTPSQIIPTTAAVPRLKTTESRHVSAGVAPKLKIFRVHPVQFRGAVVARKLAP